MIGDPYLYRDDSKTEVVSIINSKLGAAGKKAIIVPLAPAMGAVEALEALDKVSVGVKGIFLSGVYSGALYNEIRKKFPDQKVILIGSAPNLAGGKTWVVNSSRLGASKVLGLGLGRWIAEKKLTNPVKVAGLFFVGNPERQKEYEAFKEGLFQSIPSTSTVLQTFYRLRESEAFRDQVATLTAQNPGVFVCFGSVNNTQFLEQITQGPLILESFFQGHPKSSKVLGYMEEDWPGIFESAVKALAEDNGREVVVPSKVKMNPDFEFTVQKPGVTSR